MGVDKTKTLGELLVERGNLPRSRRELLEALVEEHLRSHHGTRELGCGEQHERVLAGELRAIGDADLNMSIAAAGKSRSLESTGPYLPEASDGVRYQLLRRHAKGGLGEVFVALNRRSTAKWRSRRFSRAMPVTRPAATALSWKPRLPADSSIRALCPSMIWVITTMAGPTTPCTLFAARRLQEAIGTFMRRTSLAGRPENARFPSAQLLRPLYRRLQRRGLRP